MRIVILLYCFMLKSLLLWAQSPGNDLPQRPAGLQESRQVVAVTHAGQAGGQAAKWRQLTRLEPRNATAWLNRFTWEQRMKDSPACQRTYREALQQVPESGETALMGFIVTGRQDSLLLQEAFQKITVKTTVYPHLIRFALENGYPADFSRYTRAYFQLAPLLTESPLYSYYYNVLQSADSNALLHVSGDNDLLSLAVLQQVHRVRTDITLQANNTPAPAEKRLVEYYCLSAGKTMIGNHPAAAYSGLLIRLQPADDLAAVAGRMRMDYLHRAVYTGEMAQIHMNYLPFLLLQYRQYKKTDIKQATYWKSLAEKVAAEGGKDIQALLEKE
jgi:hypothetical protein